MQSTNMFFFDSSNTRSVLPYSCCLLCLHTDATRLSCRPLTVLFLPTADVPASARSGTVQLADAAGYSPLQVIEGITTPDAAAYDFTLQLAEGTEFEVFAFFENGEGKALSLTRTVTTALPNASSCLTNVQTTWAAAYSRSMSSLQTVSLILIPLFPTASEALPQLPRRRARARARGRLALRRPRPAQQARA